MEFRSQALIIGIVLQCIVFVVVARPEEVFNTTPPPLRTNFSCYDRAAGFYADVEADCKVYHTCDDHGNRFSYRCPEETAFRQDALICDHARLVDCQATTYDTKYPVRGSRSEDDSSPLLSVPSIYNVPPPVDDNPSDRHRHSFSRSFQVSTSDKARPGFVFSASVFLRDQQDHPVDRKSMDSYRESTYAPKSPGPILDSGCNRNEEHKADSIPKHQVFAFSSTPRSFSHNSHVHDSGIRTSVGRTFANLPAISTRTQPPRRDSYPTTVFSHTTKPPVNYISRPNSNAYNRDYPYFETLRSIQANAKSTTTSTPRTVATTSSTTEIPVHALTMSLKPLVPNELEYDPYYPRTPTSTEAYYTANQLNKDPESFRFTTQPPWSGVRFEIPAVLPDLNTLEDLVDRRKLFYIPRVTPNN
ncbi:hypothetical protein KPH14_006586 [Odynerus spinipes]|uniref:Chitin-binding type-2 domain-containing protein n=1 Tax=Odynerus spinipes TaxID=1348599 RepID=A0AAD9RR84_9HYME|nr:hypothetical protein KPH14_006586 [Odynerus spinipes]